MQEIMRLFCFLIGFVASTALTPAAGWAGDPARIAPRPLGSALDAMEAERWDVAAHLAARDGPAAASLIEWYRLSDGQGTPEQVLDFLAAHGDWPGLAYLRRQSEGALAETATDTQI